MSTTPERDDDAVTRPSLLEVCADWAQRTPPADAPVAELIEWFDLKVELLQPIISDPTHPDLDQALKFMHLARKNAEGLRDKETKR